MLWLLLRDLFFRDVKTLKQEKIFYDKYGNNVTLKRVSIKGRIYIDIIVNWFAYNRFRIENEYFISQIEISRKLNEIFLNGEFEKIPLTLRKAPTISSYIYMIPADKYASERYIILNKKNGAPVIDLYICKDLEGYYCIINLNDVGRGNQRRVEVGNAQDMVQRILSFAQNDDGE
ncbi:hypothetical protein [Rhizobium sp. C4]|uniref:hypothetical protein n=1 Tax=Rhizobium sp. C4 TaxID=1349800 RepID=UPI001E407553|nr:hypothetical protein [Rhizobium sp. C4]MCD2174012.1 hypothetical protein [Rhizobium sp. C4]